MLLPPIADLGGFARALHALAIPMTYGLHDIFFKKFSDSKALLPRRWRQVDLIENSSMSDKDYHLMHFDTIKSLGKDMRSRNSAVSGCASHCSASRGLRQVISIQEIQQLFGILPPPLQAPSHQGPVGSTFSNSAASPLPSLQVASGITDVHAPLLAVRSHSAEVRGSCSSFIDLRGHKFVSFLEASRTGSRSLHSAT